MEVFEASLKTAPAAQGSEAQRGVTESPQSGGGAAGVCALVLGKLIS